MSGSLIQLHDSQLASVLHEGSNLVIRFEPAILIQSEGIPLADASTEWTQSGQLIIGEAEVEGEWPSLPATVTGGSVDAMGLKTIDMIRMPMAVEAGYVELVLEFPDHRVAVTGESIHLTMEATPRYVRHIED